MFGMERIRIIRKNSWEGRFGADTGNNFCYCKIPVTQACVLQSMGLQRVDTT